MLCCGQHIDACKSPDPVRALEQLSTFKLATKSQANIDIHGKNILQVQQWSFSYEPQHILLQSEYGTNKASYYTIKINIAHIQNWIFVFQK